MITQVKTFCNYRALLWEFVKKDIKLKYRNSFLGIIWSMLNPLLIMVVLTFIFSNLFKNKIPNFPVYCLSGRLIYDFFAQATNQSMNSITGKSSLIKKIYVPKYLYPLSRVISSFIIFLISLVPLILIMIVTKVQFTKITLLILYPLVCLFFISLGVGLVLATINVFFRDMQHLYSVVLLVIMYASAIFYSADIINPQYVAILNLNPIFPVIKVFRDCILTGQITATYSWLLCAVYAIVSVIIGIIMFYKNQDKFILHI
ncbi:ABC transporter permease [Clostridium botulinum]|uniref:Transport permease protein n=1 Tax=Clostridium botulinum TaxID=1491 RepID=A0A6B4FDQ6_CLOBO|nr:ABC transporter permease [Clostridium botulinum]NFE85039.1 ABC transporter permease [Clostridium botulinum]NFF88301.1 ABC transporter permease [Clostridium botulinum]NFG38074.1 ABC transporter permease [Clostridium botulinum]NFL36686.1 ABC transporter permease [Clostridium botulinum]NFL65565.1 ABC transporter permease [Clostridium botulinum]